MPSQVHEQTVTFPTSNSVNRVLRQLKKEENSLFNCACSVSSDATFIDEVSHLHSALPVIANLRCGLWYIRNPQNTCYFKSTDGHSGNWAFSTTRLNMHVAETAASRNGCVIVDATRRGKTFPVRPSVAFRLLKASSTATPLSPLRTTSVHLQDALTKTVPVWATVLNRAVAQLRSYHDSSKLSTGGEFISLDSKLNLRSTSPGTIMAARTNVREQTNSAKVASNEEEWDTSLHLPPWVSSNERLQIEAKLDQWVRDLCQVTLLPPVVLLVQYVYVYRPRALQIHAAQIHFTPGIQCPTTTSSTVC